MVDVKHYTYRVIWSEEDQEFIGLCAEYPSLSHLDQDQVAALTGIVALVTDVVSDMGAGGETPPTPLADVKRHACMSTLLAARAKPNFGWSRR